MLSLLKNFEGFSPFWKDQSGKKVLEYFTMLNLKIWKCMYSKKNLPVFVVVNNDFWFSNFVI